MQYYLRIPYIFLCAFTNNTICALLAAPAVLQHKKKRMANPSGLGGLLPLGRLVMWRLRWGRGFI
ncbi:MAG: hypothetical protein EAY75_12540 [Bacteroidetes bacterium]|nr:MAG: hypothetical protein EAY75_12540 [Bacteroidota bacterium]